MWVWAVMPKQRATLLKYSVQRAPYVQERGPYTRVRCARPLACAKGWQSQWYWDAKRCAWCRRTTHDSSECWWNPANKGNAVERELGVALRDTCLHPFDTSKGAFNTQYHDILVAARPLHEVPDTTTVPSRPSTGNSPGAWGW